MKIEDLEDEKLDYIPVKENTWVKDGFASVTTKNDPHALGDLSKATNLAKLAITMKTFDFADNTTMHGMRYIFMRNISQTRRLLWILIVCAGLGYCYYVFSETLKSYYEYPSEINIKTVYEKQSIFPAITICNYNALAKSKLTSTEQAIVSHIYAFTPLPENISLADYDHVDLKQFFKEKGSDYRKDFCIHKSLPCNQSLFSQHLTDFGYCLTFDPGPDLKSAFQTFKGWQGGFYFATFFNRSEWLEGPNYFEEGFRIRIHRSGTIPKTLLDSGITLLPGVTTEIAITRHETNLLPPPHGECGSRKLDYSNVYSKEDCLLECRAKHQMKICGCKLLYMPGNDNICNWEQTKYCQALIQFPPNESYLFDATTCGCPQDCKSVYFNHRMAQALPSQNYITVAEMAYNFEMSQAVGIRLFYEDLLYFEDKEVAVYTTEKLLCDIGGAAGLFLGCSFITMVEFLDFIIDFVWYWILQVTIVRRKKKGSFQESL